MNELASLPGVYQCRAAADDPVRLRAANRSRRLGIDGLPPDATLMRLKSRTGESVDAAARRAGHFEEAGRGAGRERGETVRVEVLQDKRPVADVPVVDLLDDIAGLNAYMDIDALNRLMREGPRMSGAMLTTDPMMLPAIYRELKEMPQRGERDDSRRLRSTASKTRSAKNMMHMRTINLTFAIIIALGVVYNGARISLSERSRELATLRVIGFTRREISTILLGEIGTVTLLGMPFGLVMGYWFAWMLDVVFGPGSVSFSVRDLQLDVRLGGRHGAGGVDCFGAAGAAEAGRLGFDRGVEIERVTRRMNHGDTENTERICWNTNPLIFANGMSDISVLETELIERATTFFVFSVPSVPPWLN